MVYNISNHIYTHTRRPRRHNYTHQHIIKTLAHMKMRTALKQGAAGGQRKSDINNYQYRLILSPYSEYGTIIFVTTEAPPQLLRLHQNSDRVCFQRLEGRILSSGGLLRKLRVDLRQVPPHIVLRLGARSTAPRGSRYSTITEFTPKKHTIHGCSALIP